MEKLLNNTNSFFLAGLICAYVFFNCFMAEAEEENQANFKIGGYYKNLFTASKSLTTEEGIFADTQRLRLEFNMNLNEGWLVNLIYDNEAILSDFSQTPDFDLLRSKNQKELAFWDADRVISDRDHLYWKHSLYRGYIKYYSPEFQFILGKQSIDWGRTRFWSPFDLFSPVSPLELERDERIGTDAINLDYTLSSDSSINLVYAPYKNQKNSRLGARLFKRIGNYDLFFMAGEFKKDEVLGLGFDGYIGKSGFRGEFTYTDADNGRNFFRGVIGADYNFPNKIYILGEYFYNGGSDDNDISQFLNSYQFSNRVLSMKRHLMGFLLGYELTPLIKWNNYTIYDFQGKSVFFNPEIRYNIWTNFDLSLGTQLFWGRQNSEFGSYEHIYYAQAQLFF